MSKFISRITDAYLQKELASTQETFKRYSDVWLGHEAMGRILHWMKDPTAPEFLKHAAKLRIKTLKAERIQGWELLTIGNYFRLAGESEIAENYCIRAYELLKNQVGNINNLDEISFEPLQFLIMACFLLERYQETIMYGNIYRFNNPSPDAKLLAHRFTELAEAKMTNDLFKAQ